MGKSKHASFSSLDKPNFQHIKAKFRTNTLKKKLRENDKNGGISEAEEKEKKRFWCKLLTFVRKPWSNAESCQDVPDTELVIRRALESNGDIKIKSHSSSMDIIEIPIDPGKKISKILIKPTKTGIKAVIAQYERTKYKEAHRDNMLVSGDVIPEVARMEGFNEKFEQPDEKRINWNTEDANTEVPKTTEPLLTSALFIRQDLDKIVESAVFIEPNLPRDYADFRNSDEISQKSPKSTKKRMGYKTPDEKFDPFVKTFKTVSEPTCKERKKIIQHQRLKDNINNLIKQFMFLESEDFTEFTLPSQVSECKKRMQCSTLNSRAPILNQLSREVSPEILVNRKPFKEYVSNDYVRDEKSSVRVIKQRRSTVENESVKSKKTITVEETTSSSQDDSDQCVGVQPMLKSSATFVRQRHSKVSPVLATQSIFSSPTEREISTICYEDFPDVPSQLGSRSYKVERDPEAPTCEIWGVYKTYSPYHESTIKVENTEKIEKEEKTVVESKAKNKAETVDSKPENKKMEEVDSKLKNRKVEEVDTKPKNKKMEEVDSKLKNRKVEEVDTKPKNKKMEEVDSKLKNRKVEEVDTKPKTKKMEEVDSKLKNQKVEEVNTKPKNKTMEEVNTKPKNKIMEEVDSKIKNQKVEEVDTKPKNKKMEEVDTRPKNKKMEEVDTKPKNIKLEVDSNRRIKDLRLKEERNEQFKRSLDEVLACVGDENHNDLFQKNLSQFKKKINVMPRLEIRSPSPSVKHMPEKLVQKKVRQPQNLQVANPVSKTIAKIAKITVGNLTENKIKKFRFECLEVTNWQKAHRIFENTFLTHSDSTLLSRTLSTRIEARIVSFLQTFREVYNLLESNNPTIIEVVIPRSFEQDFIKITLIRTENKRALDWPGMLARDTYDCDTISSLLPLEYDNKNNLDSGGSSSFLDTDECYLMSQDLIFYSDMEQTDLSIQDLTSCELLRTSTETIVKAVDNYETTRRETILTFEPNFQPVQHVAQILQNSYTNYTVEIYDNDLPKYFIKNLSDSDLIKKNVNNLKTSYSDSAISSVESLISIEALVNLHEKTITMMDEKQVNLSFDGFQILYNNNPENLIDDEDEITKPVFGRRLAGRDPGFTIENVYREEDEDQEEDDLKKKKDPPPNEETKDDSDKKTRNILKYKSNSSPRENIIQTEFCVHEPWFRKSLFLSKDMERDIRKKRFNLGKSLEIRRTGSATLGNGVHTVHTRKGLKFGIEETLRNLVRPDELKNVLASENKGEGNKKIFVVDKTGAKVKKELVVAAFNSIKEYHTCKGESKDGGKRMSLLIMLSKKQNPQPVFGLENLNKKNCRSQV